MSKAPLSKDERRTAVAAFHKIFAIGMASVDVYGEPFRADLPARTILYPVDPELDGDQLDALAMAAEVVGDEGFYVSLVGFDEAETLDCHWYVPLCELASYDALEPCSIGGLTHDNALYSPSGRWGMLISLEEHAIVGGTPDFLERLLSDYPERAPGWLITGSDPPPLPVEPRDQVRSFLRVRRDTRGSKLDLEALRPLLVHVYGSHGSGLIDEIRQEKSDRQP
jgi:hypothetical protein